MHIKFNVTESSIKQCLLNHLQTIERHDPAFIFEMNVGNDACRADLIVANGKLSVYEIKSASDNLLRLPKQLEVYQNYFEKVTIVCAPNHFEAVRKLAFPNTGIWIIEEDGSIKKIKRAKLTKISKENWLSFLPVILLKQLLKSKEKKTLGSRTDLVNKALGFSEEYIKNYVLNSLKRRDERINLIKEKRALNRTLIQENKNKIEEWLKSIPVQDHSNMRAIPRMKS